MRTLTLDEVFAAIRAERARQDAKWGEDRPQSLPGFVTVLEGEVGEAKLGWLKNRPPPHAPLDEILQVAATAVACLERYGISGSAASTDDIPQSGF